MRGNKQRGKPGLLLLPLFPGNSKWLQSLINLPDDPITFDDVPERIEADRQADDAVKDCPASAPVRQDVGTQKRKRQQPIPNSPLAPITILDPKEFLNNKGGSNTLTKVYTTHEHAETYEEHEWQ